MKGSEVKVKGSIKSANLDLVLGHQWVKSFSFKTCVEQYGWLPWQQDNW